MMCCGDAAGIREHRKAAATVTTLTLPVPAQGSGQQSDQDAACGGVPGPDVASDTVSACVCACALCILYVSSL
jgi:hypothetical protein